MENNKTVRPLVLGAVAIAMIAGVSGWALRARTGAITEPVPANDTAAVLTPEAVQASASLVLIPAATVPPPPSTETLLANDAAAAKIAEAGEQKLRSRYETERVDQAWASRKQQALEQLSTSPLIDQVNAQPLAINAQCRSSVCLISVDLPSRLAAEDWYSLYTMNAGTEMSTSSSRSIVKPDGSVHLQIY